MKIGVLKETQPEKRVAITPEGIKSLRALQCEIRVEKDAGASAYFADHQYQECGAEIVTREEVLTQCNLILMIQSLPEKELDNVASTGVVAGCFNPYQNETFLKKLQQNGVTSFSMELVPRTT